jgi:D-lactate dehydrogenase
MVLYLFEVFAEEAVELKSLLGDRMAYEMTSATIQESGLADPPARLISIRTQSIIPASWVDQLDGILSRSTGFDHLIRFRRTYGAAVPCGYLHEYASRAVAEHAIVLLLMLLRKVPLQMSQMAAFNRDGLTGSEWQGKRLLIVGVGRIGYKIAKMAERMGMQVRGVDLIRRHDRIHYVGRDEGLAWADAIVCAMDLRDGNYGYFSYEAFRMTKKGIIFVNIARGEHASADILLKLLDEDHFGGVGIDVYDNESVIAAALRRDGPANPEAALIRRLLGNPRVILTPHNAFNTAESVRRKAKATAAQIIQFLREGRFDPQIR